MPASRPLSSHHPIKFPDHLHPHAERPPMLALDQKRLPTPLEHQVHPAVGTVTTGSGHPVALDLKGLADERLKLPPVHLLHRPGSIISRGKFRLGPIPKPLDEGRQRTKNEGSRQDILPDREEELEHGLMGHVRRRSRSGFQGNARAEMAEG